MLNLVPHVPQEDEWIENELITANKKDKLEREI